jgi:hypothetical protein
VSASPLEQASLFKTENLVLWGLARDERLCHRLDLFMVSGVGMNRILNPER